MKTSTAFRIARAGIAAEQFSFICVALQYSQGSFRARARAMKIIQTRMGGSLSLEWWLYEQGVVSAYPGTIRKGQMQAYRLRWLDALIEEFETKGD